MTVHRIETHALFIADTEAEISVTWPEHSFAYAVNTGNSFIIVGGAKVPLGSSSGSVAWGSVIGTLSNQTDLNSALNGKQATLVSATNIKTINSSSVLGAGDLAVGAAWGDITGTLSSQTDLQTALNGKVATNDTRLSDARTPLAHGHVPGDVTGTAVITNDARLSDARTPLAHGHSETDVSSLIIDLSGKAASTHTHAEADVTALVTDLGNKQATLVSATNIKTINGSSVLGAGDLVVTGSQPDAPVTKLAPTADVTIPAGYSAVVVRRYTIALGTKLIIGLGARFQIL